MTRQRTLLVLVIAGLAAAMVGWLAPSDGRDRGAGPVTTASSPSSSSAPAPTATSTSTSTATTATTTASTTTTSEPTTTVVTPPSTAAPHTAPPTSAPPTSAPPTTGPPPTAPTTLPPVTGGDRSVYVLGDSCLLGAKETVPAALAGWIVTYDAVGSRRLPQGIEVLRANRQRIGAVVVIQQGNNYIEGEGGTFASQIDQAMTVLTGVRRVVWLTVAERWPSRVAINQAIRAAPARWPNAVVADWATLVAAHPEYASDLLHLTAAGRLAIAQLIATHVGPPPPG